MRTNCKLFLFCLLLAAPLTPVSSQDLLLPEGGLSFSSAEFTDVSADAPAMEVVSYQDASGDMRSQELPSKSYGTETDFRPSIQRDAAQWVFLEGGKAAIQVDDMDFGPDPVSSVVKPFYLAAAPVTVEQYAECVDSGRCDLPGSGKDCNWGRPDRLSAPINCVDMYRAEQYAAFKKARLPSEEELAYASDSGRADTGPMFSGARLDAAIDKVLAEHGGINFLSPVCSGRKTVEGLCDSGGMFQWVRKRMAKDPKQGEPDAWGKYESSNSFELTNSVSLVFGKKRSSSPVCRRHDGQLGYVGGPGCSGSTIGIRLAK